MYKQSIKTALIFTGYLLLFVAIKPVFFLPAYALYILILKYAVNQRWRKISQVEFYALVPFLLLYFIETFIFEIHSDLLMGWVWMGGIFLSFVIRMVMLQRRADLHRFHNLFMILLFVFLIASFEVFLWEHRIGLRYQMHNLGARFVINKMLLWAPKDVASRINNNNSFLAPRNMEKSGAPFKIIFFGGSSTAGAGLNDKSDAFPAVIRRTLKEKFPDNPIMVINAGIDSYTTFHIRRLIEMTGDDGAADIYVFYVGYNDGTPNYGPYTQKQIWEIMYGQGKPGTKKGIGWVQKTLGRIRTYQFLTRGLLPVRDTIYSLGKVPKTFPVSDQEMMENLGAIKEFCDKRKIKMVLAFEASIERRLSLDTMIRFGKENPDVTTVDVSSVILQEPLHNNLFLDNVHLTIKGHKVVAKIILNALLENQLLPNKYLP